MASRGLPRDAEGLQLRGGGAGRPPGVQECRPHGLLLYSSDFGMNTRRRARVFSFYATEYRVQSVFSTFYVRCGPAQDVQ